MNTIIFSLQILVFHKQLLTLWPKQLKQFCGKAAAKISDLFMLFYQFSLYYLRFCSTYVYQVLKEEKKYHPANSITSG